MDPKGAGGSSSASASESHSTPTVGDAAARTQDPTPMSNMVELAVKFLNNPRVWERSMEDKKSFLRKKGLTEVEINTAVGRASLQAPPTVPSGTAPPLPPRPLTPVHHPPKLRTWSEYALMAAVVGGVGYAVVHFVKSYLIPWLNSPRVQEQRLEEVHASVNQLQATVSETVSSLAESTRSIQELLAEQQQHIQLLTSQVTGLQGSLAQQANDNSLKQLKEELGSLKGILLSRHQFPATPTRGGVANGGGGIPAWQRSSDSSTLTPTPTPTKRPAEQQDSTPNGDVEDEEVTMEEGQNGNGTVLLNGNGTVLLNGGTETEIET